MSHSLHDTEWPPTEMLFGLVTFNFPCCKEGRLHDGPTDPTAYMHQRLDIEYREKLGLKLKKKLHFYIFGLIN